MYRRRRRSRHLGVSWKKKRTTRGHFLGAWPYFKKKRRQRPSSSKKITFGTSVDDITVFENSFLGFSEGFYGRFARLNLGVGKRGLCVFESEFVAHRSHLWWRSVVLPAGRPWSRGLPSSVRGCVARSCDLFCIQPWWTTSAGQWVCDEASKN